MVQTISIPKKLLNIKKDELIVVPRREYKEIAELKKRLLWEEKDTDRAIHIFEKELKENRLKRVSNFSAILGLKK
ncbi:MAG: hypothetical protein Q8R29_00930 [bacterium]|nr:hypothetical protein [bacterium]